MYYTIFAKREENFLAKIDVAPLAGARIEIAIRRPNQHLSGSLPSRERGLKSQCCCCYLRLRLVAPLAGARIEMYTQL